MTAVEGNASEKSDTLGDAEDFQPERQLIRRLLYSPTGLSIFFFGVVHNWVAF